MNNFNLANDIVLELVQNLLISDDRDTIVEAISVIEKELDAHDVKCSYDGTWG